MKLNNPVLGSKLLKWPQGTITQLFGANVALYQKAIGTNGHNGIDIVAAEGTPILASSGVVCEVKDTPNGYGKHIRILTPPNENGDYLELTYGHLRDIIVKIGDDVVNGQPIGGMGNTGFVISGSTQFWGNAPAGKGVHLHFGVRECNLKDTGWQTIYSTSKTAYIKNYTNGFKGAVNPIEYLTEEIHKEALSAIELAKAFILKLTNYIKGRKINN